MDTISPAGTHVPRDVIGIAIQAAHDASEALRRHPGPGAGRAAEVAAAAVFARRRPADGLRGREGIADRAGTTGLTWVVDPLNGAANHLAGLPFWCVSVTCEDAAGTVAAVVLDPVRDELFAAVRGSGVRFDGATRPRRSAVALADATVAGGVACGTEDEARRAGKLHKRLFRRTGPRRTLGSPALELAWTAIGRFDACFHEQPVAAWDVDAGLFLCRRAGLRVHRLPPLQAGLAPRVLAAPAELAAEVLALVGPPAKERRKAAQRAPLSPAAVADAMRRRAR